MTGAAVGDVVAVDGGQDDVVDPPLRDRLGGLSREMFRLRRSAIRPTTEKAYRKRRQSDIYTTNSHTRGGGVLGIATRRTLKGSNGSGGGGLASVLTAQNMHPRVHVSPRSMIVPVPPFQHSPTLGHRASSHTVFRLSVDRLSLTLAYRDDGSRDGAGTRNHDGRPTGMGAPTFGRTMVPPSSSSSSSPSPPPSRRGDAVAVPSPLFMGTPPPPVEPSPLATTYLSAADADCGCCFCVVAVVVTVAVSSTVENMADDCSWRRRWSATAGCLDDDDDDGGGGDIIERRTVGDKDRTSTTTAEAAAMATRVRRCWRGHMVVDFGGRRRVEKKLPMNGILYARGKPRRKMMHRLRLQYYLGTIGASNRERKGWGNVAILSTFYYSSITRTTFALSTPTLCLILGSDIIVGRQTRGRSETNDLIIHGATSSGIPNLPRVLMISPKGERKMVKNQFSCRPQKQGIYTTHIAI